MQLKTKSNRVMAFSSHFKNETSLKSSASKKFLLKQVFFFCLVFYASGSLWAQNANAKRSVLFTLGENEKIAYDEYFVAQYLNQNRFACIIEDTLKKTETFVFNGKRIGTTSAFSGYISYLNLAEDKGYIVHYTKAEDERIDHYINYKGVENGPFEIIVLSANYYDYCYLLAERWYGYKEGQKPKLITQEEMEKSQIPLREDEECYFTINGTMILIQKCDNISDLRLAESGKYAYVYKNGDKYFVNINGKESQGSDGVSGLQLTESGNFVYVYRNNNKYYVNINGKESIGYDGINYSHSLRFTESGNYAYSYKNGDKYYVNINGKESLGYDNVWDFRLTESGNYAYVYKNNDKYYVNINGNVSQGYDGAGNLCLTENGKYAYIYKDSSKCYVNINGNVNQEPLRYCYSLRLIESGKYAYAYHHYNGGTYVNINGNVSRVNGFNNAYGLCLTESGKYSYAYRLNGKEYININGNENHQGYDELGYFDCFRLTESGNYAYKYKNDGKYYININGNVSRGYDNEYFYVLTESGNYAYAYKDNDKYYININGNVNQAWISYNSLRLTESGKYAYVYKSNDKYYVNINGNVSQGYAGVDNLCLTENGNYAYSHSNVHYIGDGKEYQYKKGQRMKTEFLQSNAYGLLNKNNNAIELYSTDKENSFFSRYKDEFVVIDGRRFGKSPALHGWYDSDKNAFIWNAIEDKELVVYEYKLQ